MLQLLAYMTTPGGLTGAPRRLLTLASVLKREGIEVCIASQSGSELLEAAEMEGRETAAVDVVGVLALRQRALFGEDRPFGFESCSICSGRTGVCFAASGRGKGTWSGSAAARVSLSVPWVRF